MTDFQRREFLHSGIRHALQKSEAVCTGLLSVILIVIALVARELRRHVLSAVREATTRAELTQLNSEMAVANEIQRRLMPSAPPRRLKFSPGDLLLMVTDGFTEAANPAGGEMYGMDRLANFLTTNRHLPGPALLEHLAGDVANFTAGAAQNDDMTAVLIRRVARA
ncbi:MAG: SpoIIE family protein phosphatase [Tepidisphaeraceae bacterium]